MKGLKTSALTIAILASLSAQDANAGFLKKAIKVVKVAVAGPAIVVAKHAPGPIGDVATKTDKEMDRATDKVANELENGLENTVEAVEAAGHYVENKVDTEINVAKAALGAIADGDLDDAVESLTVDRFLIESHISAEAMQESSLLRTLGQTAASAYGGPKGAAAFSAWYAYETTGDLDTALKAGVTSGASSYLMQGVRALPEDAVAARAIAAGSVGYGIVRVSGGSSESAQRAFWMAGGSQFGRDLYANYTTKSLDMRGAEKPSVEKLEVVDGKVKMIRSVRGMDNTIAHAGFARGPGDAGIGYEGSGFMVGVSKVPGMNAMAYLHDIAAEDFDLSDTMLKATIIPAAVFTYYSGGATFEMAVTDSVLEAEER